MLPLLLLLSSTFVVVVGSSSQRCASLSPSLQCSACEEFVEAFYESCARLVFRARKLPTVERVYWERLTTIYEEHAADEVENVNSLLYKAKGKEHELYKQVCAKYDVHEDEEFDGLETEEELSAKDDLLREALSSTVERVGEEKWIVQKGRRKEKFVKKQNVEDGDAPVDHVASCYESIARDHEDTLLSTMMGIRRLKDADLHDSICAAYYC